MPGAAEAVTGQLDVAAVLARRDEVIHNLDDSAQLPWLEKRGIELVRGEGRLAGERRVAVGDDVLVARRAVVAATGSRTSMPPIDGLEAARPWTNREATTASAAPGRLVILGGGVVGVELAQAWASLGSAVSLLEAFDRLIAREEPFASRAGARRARAPRRRRAPRLPGGQGRAHRRRRRGRRSPTAPRVEGDELLLASGRRPRTERPGRRDGRARAGQGARGRRRHARPGHDWLFAIGDVNGRAPLTHMGKYQARVAALNILGGDARSVAATAPARRA